MLKRSFIVSFFVLAYLVAFSDIVILKDNTVLKGSIVSKEGEVMIFKLTDGKIIKVKARDIAVIEFNSDRVIEFVENGRRVKGIIVGESKEGVIVRSILGEKVLKKQDLEQYTSKNEVFVTNYYTNFITNFVYETNQYFFTNHITNYFGEFIEDGLPSGSNNISSLERYLKIGVGVFYDFNYTYLIYFVGFNFKVDRLVFEVNFGSFGRVFANLGFSYSVLDWFSIGSALGGFWSSESGYLFSVYLIPSINFWGGVCSLPLSLMFINLKPTLMLDLRYTFGF